LNAIFKKLSENRKLDNFNEMQLIFNFSDTKSKDYNHKLIKQKLVESYFIREKYNLSLFRNLVNLKLKLFLYSPVINTLKISFKCFIGFKPL